MRLTFTPHAERRMRERGITVAEVYRTLEEPDRDYRGRLARRIAERTPPGRRLATKVVYNIGAEGERIVVTVERGRPAAVPPPPEGGTMTYRFEHDPESDAIYVRLREGEYHETLPLTDLGVGASVDVDAEGNVLGVEFLSFGEFALVVSHHGGVLEVPERVKDAEALRRS
jgi:uncharacterized protein YuzE